MDCAQCIPVRFEQGHHGSKLKVKGRKTVQIAYEYCSVAQHNIERCQDFNQTTTSGKCKSCQHTRMQLKKNCQISEI